MLFRQSVLEKIARGEVSLALRRWKRPTVKAGGRLRTAAGVLRIGDVTRLDIEEITERDARAAGYGDRAEALDALRDDDRGALYRIEIKGIEPDERLSLRREAVLSDGEWTSIRAWLEKRDARACVSSRKLLGTIRENPETAAGVLADALGMEKQTLKRDVRKLKELGLTESLKTGYRLSPRGESVLEGLEAGS